MHIVIAMMKHETNTFSPVPTDLPRFARAGDAPTEGQDAYDAFKGTGSGIGAFIDLVEEAGFEFTIPIAANAWPSGQVHNDAYEFMAGKIFDAVTAGCDAVLRDLHGPMVTVTLA